MADPRFPDDRVHLLARAEYATTGDVARTEWDDGAIRQAVVRRAVYQRSAVSFEVREPDRLPLQLWISRHASRWFTWRSLAGGDRRARVVGGQAGVRWRQVRRSPGPPRWEVTMEVEEALALPMSIWAADLPIGDVSHVYARGRWTGRPERRGGTRPGLLGGRRETITLANAGVGAGQPLPPWMFAAGTGAAELRFLAVDSVPPAAPPADPILFLALRIGLLSDPPGSGRLAGPNLLPGAKDGLALAMRTAARHYIPSIGVAKGSPNEPYDWPATDRSAAVALVDYVVGRGYVDTSRNPPVVTGSETTVDWALVWVGAGSVVDLAALTASASAERPVLA